MGARRARPVLPLSCPRKSEDCVIAHRDTKQDGEHIRVDFTPDPGLFPFQSRFYESSVGRVHYVDEGSGIPILLLHGNPTWSFLYRKIVPHLQDAFRCIAVDYPGFGLSDRPDGYGYPPDEHSRVIGELVDPSRSRWVPILEKKLLRRKILLRSMVHPLSQAEMDHYRKAQPTPEARAGVAEFPRQILRAEPLLARLKEDVPRLLGPSRSCSHGG